MKKQTILARIAPLLLAAALALAGIWLNSRVVVLKSGQPPPVSYTHLTLPTT